MKICCGTYIVEIQRIKESIEDPKIGEAFVQRIYTEKEIAYCESKKAQKYQHYAARFAAKEAVFKAISGYLDNKYNIEWKDIELTNDQNGRPKINFINAKIEELKQCDISISHCKEYAVANVVCVFNNFINLLNKLNYH